MENLVFAENLTPLEFNDLRVAVDWARLTDKQAERVLQHSTYVLCVRDGEKAVAMGRVLFDHGFTAYIGDIIVLSDYRHKGIGSAVVKKLIQKVLDMADPGDRLLFILEAAKGKEPFYEQLGFQRNPSETQGCGMRQVIYKQ